VAEQKPFLPWECFKRKLIEAGAIGRIALVENRFRSAEYHGVAQLRRYLPGDAMPLQVRALRMRSEQPVFIDRAGEQIAAGLETWTLATIVFSNGTVGIYNFSTAYKRAPYRLGASLRVQGVSGSIVDEDLALVDSSGAAVRPQIACARGVSVERLSVRLPDGKDVVWENPIPAASLDDDQAAVGQHVAAMHEAITRGTRPLYGVHDALVDVEIVGAMDRSARAGGGPVFVAHSCADPECRPSSAASVRARFEQLFQSALGSEPFDQLAKGMRRMTKLFS
jgi:predicted dehydrogenase